MTAWTTVAVMNDLYLYAADDWGFPFKVYSSVSGNPATQHHFVKVQSSEMVSTEQQHRYIIDVQDCGGWADMLRFESENKKLVLVEYLFILTRTQPLSQNFLLNRAGWAAL